MQIKQGDEYPIAVTVTLNGADVDIEDIELVEFTIGDKRKVYPDDVDYEEGQFLVPLTQEETFTFEGSVEMDIRVKFISGNVEGIDRPISIRVSDALSEVVL